MSDRATTADSGYPEYSARLGRIAPAQFQAALDHFGLGRFVRADPIRFGNFGQVLFLTSTTGEYVLRGAPHFPWQFPEERFFARLLRERTRAPVPWPYLLDESPEIFGWSYAIMPKLPGLQLEDAAVVAGLTPDDRRGIARALGETLREMQRLTWPVAGAYDLQTDGVKSLAESHADRVVAHIRRNLARARGHTPQLTTPADARWVEELIARGYGALHEPFTPCAVMTDYKDQNVVLERAGGGWRVSGIFDLAGIYFGDGEAALSRQVARYLEREPALAGEFVRAYLAGEPPRPGFAERFPVYLLDERLAIWEWAQRERLAWWDAALTLRAWLEPFTSAGAALRAG